MDIQQAISVIPLLETALSMLRPNTREVVDRKTMSNCLQVCALVSSRINKDISDSHTLLSLDLAIQMLNELLAQLDIQEFDEPLRAQVIDKISDTISFESVDLGKFLTDTKFEYSKNEERILESICKYCINACYYFGLEEECLQEE